MAHKQLVKIPLILKSVQHTHPNLAKFLRTYESKNSFDIEKCLALRVRTSKQIQQSSVKIPLILKSVYDVKEFPESFADYEVVCDWTNENLPKGVKLHKRHE